MLQTRATATYLVLPYAPQDIEDTADAILSHTPMPVVGKRVQREIAVHLAR